MIQNKNEIVFISGLGATGSSAVVDLLKEVKSYFVLDSEFRLFVDPGGLINLCDALTKNWSCFQSGIAINNFLKLVKKLNNRGLGPYSILGHSKYFDKEFIKQSKKYINKLLELKFRGLWYGNDTLWQRQLNKFSLLHRKNIFTKPMFVGRNLSYEEFNHLTNTYIRSLIDYCLKKEQKKHFCFNENLACLFPFKIFSIVTGSKMIQVIRDPRDTFADSKRIKLTAVPEEIDKFIRWELAMYKRWMEIEREIKLRGIYGKIVKVMKFEDLILNYDQKVTEIFEFLNIQKDDHLMKKKFLNPKISMQNIGLWQKWFDKESIEKMNIAFKPIYNRYNYNY